VSRSKLWFLGAMLGILTVLAAVFALTAAIVVGLLVIPLARKPGGPAAVSGLLTGFGALWLLLMVAESSSGGQLDNATFWAAVGAVPLAIGLALPIWIVSAPRPPGEGSGSR
jgi:hypothetical protein